MIRNREYIESNLAMGFDNEPVVRFLFQRQFKNPSVIEMQFESVVEMNWVHNDLHSDTGTSVIYESVLTFIDGLTYWAEDIDWSLSLDNRNDFRWIAAKRVKWRIVEYGLGKTDKLISLE